MPRCYYKSVRSFIREDEQKEPPDIFLDSFGNRQTTDKTTKNSLQFTKCSEDKMMSGLSIVTRYYLNLIKPNEANSSVESSPLSLSEESVSEGELEYENEIKPESSSTYQKSSSVGMVLSSL
ncbi:Protein of unknown function [Gryllus bimaculatus]|nr:Protein of unknown function [Gryllus bimaculatus]